MVRWHYMFIDIAVGGINLTDTCPDKLHYDFRCHILVGKIPY